MWYLGIDNKFICCFDHHLSNKIKGDYCHCNFITTIFHPLARRIKPTHDKGWKIDFGKRHTIVDHEPNHMVKPYNGTFACCLFIIRKACAPQKKPFAIPSILLMLNVIVEINGQVLPCPNYHTINNKMFIVVKEDQRKGIDQWFFTF